MAILALAALVLVLPADRNAAQAQSLSNTAPSFTEGSSTSRSFNETVGDAAVTTASNIGTAVAATDPDAGETLTYFLKGTDAARFRINKSSGQLQTKVGEQYDYEAGSSYEVTVRAVDGSGAADSITVTLNVTDRNEAPLTPAAPAVVRQRGARGA